MMPGSYATVSLDDAKTAYLAAVGGSDKFLLRMYVTDFVSAEEQAVAGINYRVAVKGCIVTDAKKAGGGDCPCAAQDAKAYTVSIYCPHVDLGMRRSRRSCPPTLLTPPPRRSSPEHLSSARRGRPSLSSSPRPISKSNESSLPLLCTQKSTRCICSSFKIRLYRLR
ncbi:Aste57867_14917 [Aphanomyces stellatus]|uniref:Aste57867_14917 protein n=1 Tax=Aphanomyces stellatus TaxID=120398 RepID=A0A485L1X0_9STRA|nr:hypothetical protein As57867_014861 [Aphanomyces stellatus]VFT91732.1 Aste57867_14917 [Aphanomyces stellatus]